MTGRIPRILLLIAALALTALLAGCGGGGGSSSGGWVIDDQLFTPNYIADLDGALYHWSHLAMRADFSLPADWAARYGGQPLQTQAADEWNGGGLTMITITSAAPDTTVTFVNQLPGLTLGRTQFTYDSLTGRMNSATIEIALNDSIGNPQPADDMRAVIAHELGHALGIGGHSTTSTDLMYTTLNEPAPQSVGERDMHTIMTAYPSFFGVPFVQEEPARGPEHLVTKVIECSHEDIFGSRAH